MQERIIKFKGWEFPIVNGRSPQLANYIKDQLPIMRYLRALEQLSNMAKNGASEEERKQMKNRCEGIYLEDKMKYENRA